MKSKLKQRRLELRLRLVDVARLSGVSVGQIWNHENGLAHRANDKTRQKLAKALGVKVEEIFPEK